MEAEHTNNRTERPASPNGYEMSNIPRTQAPERRIVFGNAPRDTSPSDLEDGIRHRTRSVISIILCAFPWLLETAACLLAVVCLVAIVVIMFNVDGRPSPVWHLGQLVISANAIVALAAEIAKVCVTMVSGSLLAQFKWEWFEGVARFLYDLQRYDDASHGPWGSTRLFFSWKSKDRILAVIMITSLFTAPITQQTLEYRTALVSASEPGNINATVPVVRHLTRWNDTSLSFNPGDVDRNLLTEAILSSSYVLNQEIDHVKPSCASADCVWPIYASLGICSAVKNITIYARSSTKILLLAKERIDHLYNPAYSNPSSPMYVPGSYTSTNILISSPLWAPTGVWNTTVMQNMHANIFIAYADDPVSIPTGFDTVLFSQFQFLDVAFFWCVTSFSTNFTNGVAKTVEISSRTQLTDDGLARLTNTVPSSPISGGLDTFYNSNFSKVCYAPYPAPPCVGFGGTDIVLSSPDNRDSEPRRGEIHYAVDLWTALAVSYLTYFTLTGGLLQTPGLTTFAREGDAALALSAAIFGDRVGLTAYPHCEQLERMQRLAANIARGLSNGLRALAGGPDARADDAQFVRGTVLVQQTVLAYEWKWLMWLVVQLILVFCVLGWTIVVRSKLPIMKDSIPDTADIFGRSGVFLDENLRQQRELKETAKKSLAILTSRGDGALVMVPPEMEERPETSERVGSERDQGRREGVEGEGDRGGIHHPEQNKDTNLGNLTLANGYNT